MVGAWNIKIQQSYGDWSTGIFQSHFGNGTQRQPKTQNPTKPVKFKENHQKTQEILFMRV